MNSTLRIRLGFFLSFLILLGAGARASAAAGDNNFSGALPLYNIFPIPTGILFPSLLTAAGVNPAALPQNTGKRVNAAGLTVSPPPGDGAAQYEVGLAASEKSFGMGAGYIGKFEDNTATHGIYLGGGFRTQTSSLGLGLRQSDLRNGFQPDIDLGFVSRTTGDGLLGLVIYRLQDSPLIDLGFGVGKDKNYNFEVNVLLPTLATITQPGSNFVFTAATTVYISFFGLSFKSSYATGTSEVAQSVSLLLWLSKSFGMAMQYSSPNRTYYNMTFLF